MEMNPELPSDWEDPFASLPPSPLFPENPNKRGKYQLIPEAHHALRERILSTQPWKKATGPKTILGKIISSQNALKHGYYAKDAGIPGRMYRAEYMRGYRQQAADRPWRLIARPGSIGKGP
jgi:hypothetical protein